MGIEYRNLKLLVIDDNDISSLQNIKNISLVEARTVGGKFIPSISRWDTHCLSLAFQKELEFDLCTVDISFALDNSDPQYGTGTGLIISGFVHALASFSRHVKEDGFGNTLPLSWEIRSMSPEDFTPDDKNGIVRSHTIREYGLLRSLKARPKDNDGNLIHCLLRENIEAGNNKTDMPEDLIDCFKKIINSQTIRMGSGDRVKGDLLSPWREEFLSKIKASFIKINVSALDVTIKYLKGKVNNRGFITLEKDKFGRYTKDFAIEIQNSSFESEYGLRIWSIMADIVDSNYSLNITEIVSGITDYEGKPCSVIEWLTAVKALGDQSEYADLNKAQDRLIDIAKQVLQRISDTKVIADKKHPWDFWGNRIPTSEKKNKSTDRVVIYLVCITLHYVFGRDNEYPINDQEIAISLGLESESSFIQGKPWESYVFNRPVKESRFDGMRTANSFKGHIIAALDGGGASRAALFSRYPWIRQGLKKFLLSMESPHPFITEKELRKKAPGLFTDRKIDISEPESES